MSVVWEEALDKERRAAGLGWRVPRHGHVRASTASKTSLLFASSSLSPLHPLDNTHSIAIVAVFDIASLYRLGLSVPSSSDCSGQISPDPAR